MNKPLRYHAYGARWEWRWNEPQWFWHFRRYRDGWSWFTPLGSLQYWRHTGYWEHLSRADGGAT